MLRIASPTRPTRLTLTGAALAASLPFMTAHAQTQPDAAAEADTLEEIVVTAQRRAELLSTVPLAVTAITGESWGQTPNFGIGDLAKMAPSLTFEQTTSTRNNSVRIRGIGTNSTSSGLEPSTATVIDGIVLIRSGQAAAANLIDIERIEVLRGPQGTLFGKNASVGVVNIVTQAPSDVLTAQADLLATNDDEYQVRGSISGPLSPTLRGRLSAFYRDYEGNVRNVRDGEMQNGAETKGLRAKLALDASENLTVQLTADYSTSDSNCCARPVREIVLTDPRNGSVIAGAGVTLNNLRPVVPGVKNNQVNTDTEPKDNFDSFIGGLDIGYALGDFDLTAITSYQHFTIDQQLDDDQSPNAPVAGGQPFAQDITSNEKVKGLTQELRVASPSWDSLDFVGGLYLFRANIDQTSDNIRRHVAAPQNRVSRFNSETRFRNYAAFGQVNVHVSEDLTALFGARYTLDRTANDYRRDDFDPAPFRNGDTAFSAKVKENHFSWKSGLEYEWSPATFTYVTYSTGYKGPGFGVASDSRSNDPIIQPETSNNWEAGAKLRLLDRRLALNGALFHSVFDDFGVNSFDLLRNAPRFINAAKLTTKGVETDLTWLLGGGFTLSGGGAYVHARMDIPATSCFAFQTVAQGCTVRPGFGTGELQDIVDGRIPSSPEWKFNVNAQYDVSPDGLPFDMTFRVGYVWLDDQQLSLTQDPTTIQQSYGLLDASIAFASKDGVYRFELFGRNLTDQFYVGGVGPAQSLRGADVHFIPRDSGRYFGARLSATY